MIDLEAKFSPSLLNTGVYLLGLSQTISTFAVNYIGRPWRESIRENKYLYYGMVSVGAIAVSGATEFMPELNEWLQLVKMKPEYQLKWSWQWEPILPEVMFSKASGHCSLMLSQNHS